MKTIRLLHLGDVHYPQVNANSRVVDQKDLGISSSFVKAVSTDKLQSVARAICSLLDQGNLSAILLSGDLTSWGDIQGYSDCLDYLSWVLALRERTGKENNDFHVVPGNHDVDRGRCSKTGDFYSKFESIEKLWKKIGLPILTVRDVRSTTISDDGCNVQISSLNSCVGCGEKRSLPEKIEEDLYKLLADYTSRTSLEEAFKLVGEQLDTPAFMETHMASLVQQIGALGASTLPLVLAHHNLLPQAMPQVSVYTEVINAGLVRNRLLELLQPIVYCHGHIHCDPIEIISTPDKSRGPVISMSAPLLETGFNVVEIWFGQKDIPLGLTIVPYRATDDGSVTVEAAGIARVRLRQPQDYITIGHTRLAEVLRHVRSENFERFPVILERVRVATGSHVHENTMADPIREAEWFGLVSILDSDEKPKYWQIMKNVP